MAEVIDISRFREAARRNGPRAAPSLRIRIGGPDPRWLGVVGGILAAALAMEGAAVDFTDPAVLPPESAVIDLLAGTPPAIPALLIGGGALPPPALRDCTGHTLLLAWPGGATTPAEFPGRLVALPLSDPDPMPLTLAAACAGGAARLLGSPWNVVEEALRQELFLVAPLEAYLIAAFESYHLLAPWAGAALRQSRLS